MTDAELQEETKEERLARHWADYYNVILEGKPLPEIPGKTYTDFFS